MLHKLTGWTVLEERKPKIDPIEWYVQYQCIKDPRFWTYLAKIRTDEKDMDDEMKLAESFWYLTIIRVNRKLW